MNDPFMPFLGVLVALPILLVLQRWIHQHLHGIALLITNKQRYAVILYALILLPGVFLHEASHWVAAKLLGVRTGAFSVTPKQQADGSIQLGYVEYYKSHTLDPVRETLIGGAPLIVGTAVTLLISHHIFNYPQLAALIQTGQLRSIGLALRQLIQTPDIFLWLYLLFAIVNGMMPSRSDRRAWPAFALSLLLFAILLYLLGITNIVFLELIGPVTWLFGHLSLAFSLAIGINLLFMGLLALAEWAVGQLKGVTVTYGRGS